jgi:cytochrome c oxidase accessory protein FixG
MEPTAAANETFRDSIGTISKEGKRNWLYPKKPKGKRYNARTLFGISCLIILFAVPWIKLNGQPFMLFNILKRHFILFGIPFWPQDFFLLVLAMLSFIVFICLFTLLFGRLWCGWACPQTIFMEIVFRRIEYFIEGDYMQQKALNSAPPSPKKFLKKLAKHSIFFGISFLIANTFLAYIIGIDELKIIVTDHLSSHLTGLIAITVFTAVFYGVYARFREQVCLVVCPYGRLQGVLLDPDSVVIAYDYKRGEPKGKLNKTKERTLGDCIDCHQCVQVCPTGIDIRNGTQLECINCTACVDACDAIMERISKPKGLIRYASENNIKEKSRFRLTPKIIGYLSVMLILFSSFIVLLASRSDVDATVLRIPGMLFQKMDNNRISNLYNIKIINKTFNDIPAEIKVRDLNGEIKWIGKGISLLPANSITEGEFFLILNNADIHLRKTPIQIEIVNQGRVLEKTKTSFLGTGN